MQDAVTLTQDLTQKDIKMTKRALGKGLSALLESDGEGEPMINENIQPYEMKLNLIQTSKIQPREYFEETSLQELAESIKTNGVLQPILVRKSQNSQLYEIIAGERRFRAAKIAELQTIPVIVKDYDDKHSLELALIENIQRENLRPIEEAEGYKRLQDEFKYTQEQLADVLGKSRSHIANILRLLTLPQTIKDMINSGAISMSHARVLVGAAEPQLLANKIITEGLNVREAEKFAAGSGLVGGGIKAKKPIARKTSAAKTAQKDDDLIALERSLSESIGLKVLVEDSAEGGRVILYFNNLTELDKILQKIG